MFREFRGHPTSKFVPVYKLTHLKVNRSGLVALWILTSFDRESLKNPYYPFNLTNFPGTVKINHY